MKNSSQDKHLRFRNRRSKFISQPNCIRYNRVNLCTKMTNLTSKTVRYNRVFVNNRVRYSRVSLYFTGNLLSLLTTSFINTTTTFLTSEVSYFLLIYFSFQHLSKFMLTLCFLVMMMLLLQSCIKLLERAVGSGVVKQ